MSTNIDYPYNQTTASDYLVCECAAGAGSFLIYPQDVGASEKFNEVPPANIKQIEDSPSLVIEAPLITEKN
ncbi:hypothetical protein KAR10_06060 [bacterium]|nr:hypothetical protein [bacterium]